MATQRKNIVLGLGVCAGLAFGWAGAPRAVAHDVEGGEVQPNERKRCAEY